MTRNGAPKPPNFGEMVSAWDNPQRFAELVNDYYASLEPAPDVIDITEPRRRIEDEE